MKKYIIFLLLIFMVPLSGCTIDYSSYYDKYGDVVNKEDPTKGLTSSLIGDGVLSYPSDNSTFIEKYSEVYSPLASEYSVYSSYYSSTYNTIYIAYDKISNPSQTIDSRDLALIEEHLLNYFESDSSKSEYRDYIKAIRVYPDYDSSACRVVGDSSYTQIEGCANYNQQEASINLNGLVNIDRFFNPLVTTEGNITTYVEPKRDTFAHEYGHVSTYYHMVLKSDNNYEDYLRLRLDGDFDNIYPDGILTRYDSDLTYDIQPSEILADDYVELYYNVSSKVESDVYEYELSYNDLRNSLSKEGASIYKLRENTNLFNSVKAYYDTFLNKNEVVLETPKVVRANGSIYNTLHDLKNGNSLINVTDKLAIVLSEITINQQVYYRIVISNVVLGASSNIENNDLRDYSNNIGYILKSECEDTNETVIRFDKYNGESINPYSYLTLDSIGANLLPLYDFAYFIDNGNSLKIYSLLDTSFDYKNIEANNFK